MKLGHCCSQRFCAAFYNSVVNAALKDRNIEELDSLVHYSIVASQLALRAVDQSIVVRQRQPANCYQFKVLTKIAAMKRQRTTAAA